MPCCHQHESWAKILCISIQIFLTKSFCDTHTFCPRFGSCERHTHHTIDGISSYSINENPKYDIRDEPGSHLLSVFALRASSISVAAFGIRYFIHICTVIFVNGIWKWVCTTSQKPKSLNGYFSNPIRPSVLYAVSRVISEPAGLSSPVAS